MEAIYGRAKPFFRTRAPHESRESRKGRKRHEEEAHSGVERISVDGIKLKLKNEIHVLSAKRDSIYRGKPPSLYRYLYIRAKLRSQLRSLQQRRRLTRPHVKGMKKRAGLRSWDLLELPVAGVNSRSPSRFHLIISGIIGLSSKLGIAACSRYRYCHDGAATPSAKPMNSRSSSSSGSICSNRNSNTQPSSQLSIQYISCTGEHAQSTTRSRIADKGLIYPYVLHYRRYMARVHPLVYTAEVSNSSSSASNVTRKCKSIICKAETSRRVY
ncbi:unnamed protein product [Trichogramma brassicae]|uniref:Uncharacterized protein n=1 Tax=Trichogramma brassicae TaxID=86971 RepID=A0A6H5IWM3_9HYME|nr:unnamed protein product [Trichogramma brassicae]